MKDISKIAQTILAELDCPRSLTVAILLREGEWTQLVNLKAEVADYDTPMSYRRAVQATDLLRKAGFLPTEVDLHGEALKTFFLAEQQCYRTNERLYQFVFQPPRLNGKAPEAILALARKYIDSWLGPFSDLRVAELARHGPGATYFDRGQLTTPCDKMSSLPSLTPDSWPWLFPWSSTAWASACVEEGYSERPPVFIPGNRFTSVPKDSSKNRGIAIEPSINMFYQLGLGNLVRDRLRRNAGVDLLHAQKLHRAVARAGSITGEVSTIDLSNASDTVCKNLVRILTPHSWFEAFNSLRSPKTFVEGKWVLLEKFSSMGNGFTFELETLIFMGLAAAVNEFLGKSFLMGTDIHVYGDDIIVPTSMASELLVVLGFCGFTPNPKKTFISGPFRESCGGDFYDGEAVRPLYIKDDPQNPFEWMVLANQVRAFFGESLAWKRCLDHLPSSWRQVEGPSHLGDVCLHTSNESRWRRRTKDCITWQRAMLPVPDFVGWEHFKPSVILATALYGAGDGRRGVIPRGGVSGYRLGWVSDS